MNKITIIGAGSVGSTIAYALTITGIASNIVMIDINGNKALGEALDINYAPLQEQNFAFELSGRELCKTLAEIGYEGAFNYEAGNFYSRYMEDDFIPIAAKFAEQVGRSLIRIIEEFKSEIRYGQNSSQSV